MTTYEKNLFIPVSVADPALLPTYANNGDAGMDLRSAEDVIIPAGKRALVSTGLKMSLPSGFVGLIHPRSGLAIKQGLTVLNAPGTIDSGYRGEIKVILLNTSDVDVAIVTGDRIAQMVIQEFVTAKLAVVPDGFISDDTERGERGFGSTEEVNV